MNENIEVINRIINEMGVTGKAELIRSALSTETNRNLVNSDLVDRVNKSTERFEKAKAKYSDEERLFNLSSGVNSEIVLEKHIKLISSKLEALGF